jgi:hypothetical protein
MILEGQVGPQSRTDGATIPTRSARDGTLVLREGAGRYSESSLRGNIYTLFSGEVSGATALNKESAAGTIKLICGIYNPAGSNTYAVVLDFIASVIEGTKMSGPFVYSYQQCPAVTSTATGTIQSCNINPKANTRMIAQNNVVIVRQDAAATTFTSLRMVGGSANKESALSASVPEQRDRPEGSIVIPPGTIFGINEWAAGTESKYIASLTWEEIGG